MTDEREPLRVGPLVLSALRSGGTFETCELWAGMALIRAGLCVEVPHERTSKEVGSVPPFGALKLTPAGRLVAAQYRSRRRLLAKLMLVKADRDDWRAEHRESHHGDYDKAKFLRKRAAKYARWAKNLSEL